MTWAALGRVLPNQLSGARVQLHWATQLVSAPGTSLLPAAPDFSQTNLRWEPSLGILAGRACGPEQRRAGLVFEGLELVVLDGEREAESLRLAGQTMQQALAWLGERIASDPVTLSLPSHEMPPHRVAHGSAFSDAGVEERIELAAWFADAAGAIADALADEHSASELRCWPHHFDLASLIPLGPQDDPETARSIGVGFSPGDGSYPQPYFYVTPWPYPDSAALPSLTPPTRWHSDGWTGAVLSADDLLSMPPSRQEETLREALREAIGATHALLAP